MLTDLNFQASNFIPEKSEFKSDAEKATALFQNAIIYAVHHPRFNGKKPTIAFIEEGPYAIPMAVG
jgi:hypothetical protein